MSICRVHDMTYSSSSSSPHFDSEQFKIAQRQSWDGAAPGWKEWWKHLKLGHIM
jgi:hypothetical protein